MKVMNKLLLESVSGWALVALMSVGASTMPAQSQTLDGENLTAEWLFPSFDQSIESHDVVVGPGVELPAEDIVNDSALDIDIGANFVRFEFGEGTSWFAAPFNGWRFTDTDSTIPPIVEYRIESVSGGVTGLEPSDLGWTTDTVWANFGGVEIASPGDFIVLELEFGIFVESFESGDFGDWIVFPPPVP